MMNIQKTANGSALTLAVEGRLDTSTAPTLDAELKSTVGVTELVFDFAKLEYISSAGLRVLLTAQKQMNRQGGKMIIRHACTTVAEVFAVTGFTKILTIE